MEENNIDYLTNVKAFCIFIKMKCTSNNKLSFTIIAQLPGNNHFELFLQDLQLNQKMLEENLVLLVGRQ